MILLSIVLYYFAGMITSAWLLKIGKIGEISNYTVSSGPAHVDVFVLRYIVIPLFWPAAYVWMIMKLVGKIHMAIYAVIFHAINVFNMRIVKDGDDTEIRFHVPKKTEL